MEDKCIHYWLIESPTYDRRNYRTRYDSFGSWSKGVCKKCGEEKEISNSNRTKELDMEQERERIKKQKESLQEGEK